MKVLVLANSSLVIYNFRLEFIQELLKDNEVYVSLPIVEGDEKYEKIVALGAKCINTEIDRRGVNPAKDFSLLMHYKKIIGEIKPDLVMAYTIKPNIYGSIASKMAGIPYMVNITGLGTAVENDGLLQKVTLSLYKTALKKASCVFFQNEETVIFL